MKQLIIASTLLALSISLSGCGGGPKLVPAEGTITSKGAPLGGANITVIYPDGNNATGVSDDAGKFILAYGGRNGAVPGADLKVSVVKRASGYEGETVKRTGPPKPGEDPIKDMAQAMKDSMIKSQSKKEEGPKDEIDAKYGKADSSGIKVSIPEGGKKDLKIDLP